MIKLLGILVVAVGFGFRVNALVVVLAAGVATGLSAGLPLRGVVALLGRFFVENRGLVLPIVLMLPVVGLLEKHGLQERVGALMRRSEAATAGRILWLYQALRGGLSVLGISLGSHAGMVRPLVAPMAEAAASNQLAALRAEGAAKARGELSAADSARVRAHGAAAENVGNFFSDDILVAVGALLLVKAFFDTAGVPVTLEQIKLWSLPTALWVLLVGWWRYRALDRRLAQRKEDGP
ncbi:MAG: DUF969 domain-containing protein [Opitutae bacterium]|nr:DUF969 domain-containing protein [Opitutae bacterium]